MVPSFTTASPQVVLVLSHSDHRFNLLFRAVDSIGGDGMVEQEDLIEFMFPGNAKEEAAQGAAGMCQALCLASNADDRCELRKTCLYCPRADALRLQFPTGATASGPLTAPTCSTVTTTSSPSRSTRSQGADGNQYTWEIRQDIAASRGMNADGRFVASVTSADFNSTNWSR
jgi:hypothetical protein